MGNRTHRTSLSRRDFLRLATIVVGSALLAACQQAPAPAAKPADTRPSEAAKPAAPVAAAPTAAPAKPAEAAKAAKPAADAKPASAPVVPVAGTAPKKGGTLNYADAADFTHVSPWSVTPPNQGIYNQVFNRPIYVATDPRIWAFTIPVKNIYYDLSGNMALAGAYLDK
jgi:hypothetical protein